MKIAVWHNLPSGGGKRALYQQVRGLTERGHSVESWSLDTADHSWLPLSEFAPEHVRESELNHRSSQWRALPDGRASAWLISKCAPDYHEATGRMRAFDEASRRCAHEIEAGNFDLLFAGAAFPYSMPYIMRHVRIPNVLYLQEPCRFLYEAAPVLPWVSGAPDDLEQAHPFRLRQLTANYSNLQTLRLQAKQEWLNARACGHILVNSYFSRESVLRTYGVEAKVCYLGVDTTLFRNLGLERERFIVGLGSFNSTKGIDLAVNAVALLPEPRPPLVWIANSADETYKNTINELARSLKVELQIQMAISDAELVAVLNKAALLLYTPRLEPFGLAPLEANACGLPVVGLAEGGVRETIQDGLNGFLVDPEPESLAGAANRLLQDPKLAKQMGENAVANIQRKWNLEQSIDRLEAFLLQAVSSGRREG